MASPKGAKRASQLLAGQWEFPNVEVEKQV